MSLEASFLDRKHPLKTLDARDKKICIENRSAPDNELLAAYVI